MPKTRQSPENEVPVYPSGTAVGLLSELAETIEQQNSETAQRRATSVLSYSVVCCADDARAIRWALKKVGGGRVTMPETRQRPENDCPVCFFVECDCPCATCTAAHARREREGATPSTEFADSLKHALHAVPSKQVQHEEQLRLLLVIDAEAGSEHADREAERLGLTIQLAVARERRAVRGAL